MRKNHDVFTSRMLVVELVMMLKLMHLAFKDWMPTLEDVLNDKTIVYDMVFNDERKEEMFTYIEALRSIVHTYGIRLDLKRADLDVELTLESNYFDTLKYLNEYLMLRSHHHIKQNIFNGDYIKVYVNFERYLELNKILDEPVMHVYQKALNQMKNLHKDIISIEAFETLQTLIDKEKAVPLYFDQDTHAYMCIECNHEVEDESAHYCMMCGQKIKKERHYTIH